MDGCSRDKSDKPPPEIAGPTFLQTPQSSSPLPQKDIQTPRSETQRVPNYVPSIEMLHLATLHRLNAQGSRKAVGGKKTLSRTRAKPGDFCHYDSIIFSEGMNSIDTAGHDSMFGAEIPDDYNYDDDDDLNAGYNRGGDTVCQKTYTKACQLYKVTPSSSIFNGLKTNQVILKNLDIGPKGAKACAIALASNATVEKLDLEGNAMGPEGAKYICEMLLENSFITDVNLGGNRFGTEGLKLVCDILRINENLQKMNLSGNGLKEQDAVHIQEMLEDNITLKDLNISHNEFCEEGGEILADAIEKNLSLEILDLRWNHLRRRGATSIARSLQKNLGLLTLKLGWNGFYLDGCIELGKSLSANSTLQHLDVSCNRIDRECLAYLLNAFRKNETLVSLNVSDNPIGSDGALDIVETLAKYPNNKVKEVNLQSQGVTSAFLARKGQLSHINFIHGVASTMDSSDNLDQDSIFMNDDPMMVLMEFARLSNLRLVDLFISLDKDGSGSLSHDEFRQGLMASGVPLSQKGLDKLVKKLDNDNDGEVDFTELMLGQKDHKKKVFAMKKRATEREIAFADTELGIINSKIQTLFNIRRLITKKKLEAKSQFHSATSAKISDQALEGVVDNASTKARVAIMSTLKDIKKDSGS